MDYRPSFSHPSTATILSYNVNAKILDMAAQLPKRAGEHNVKIAGVKVEVALTLIASVMSLGPHFVRPHLPIPPTRRKGLNVCEREALFRSRVHQCFTALGFSCIAKTT